jgi:zinc and cadmium transporter
VNPVLGLSTTIAIASHEIPQEFADFSILLHCGLKKEKALLYNFISALAAVIGGIAGFFLLKEFQAWIPYAVAVAAGIFIYVSSADLIPELHKTHKKGELISQVLPFVAGIILMMVMARFVGH